jgi:hypothetical protein
MKERGLRHGAKSRKWQPTNGQENCKITILPTSNGQVPSQITYRENYISDITRIRVMGNKNMTMVDNDGETFSKMSSMTFCVLMMTKEATKNCYEGHIEVKEEKNSFLSLYLKIFNYGLGGYYHRERWPRT